MRASIRAIEYAFPVGVLCNTDLSAEFPDWGVQKIWKKTGIDRRYIAAEEECASDLAVRAASRLFDTEACRREEIDFVLLCTQSPDYFLPTTACLVQDRLGLPTHVGALDYNLGCSGFVYGLGLAKGLIETGQARVILLLTAETYSKFLDREDRGSRTIFGDGAAATLICAQDDSGAGGELVGPFVYGTDGSGADNLIVATGGLRRPGVARPLVMNGSELFAFTIRAVPPLVNQLLERAGRSLGEVDLFVFHQANRFMLDHLRDKLGIPPDRFFLNMERCGNTVSSTIPIALRDAQDEGLLKPGCLTMTVGFGVGYSWAATLIRWTGG